MTGARPQPRPLGPAVAALLGRPASIGTAVGLGAAALYLVGAGRAFGLDAGVSVANFIATPSLLDPLRRQVLYNNHVAFSFAEHVVYSVTGSRSEWVLRLLPVAFAAVAVALLAVVLARAWGRLAAVAGGAVVATSPLMVENCRDVRGYSLIVLCAVGATLLLVRLGRRDASGPTSVGYVALLAAGIATHVYAAAVIPLHAAAIRWERGGAARWLVRWAAACALGALALAGVLGTMLDAAQSRARHFQPGFPVHLAGAFLGRSTLTAALLAPLLVAGAWELRRGRPLLRLAVALGVVVAVPWLLAPRELYQRFFVWLVPALGVLAAAAIARHRWMAVLAVAAVVTQVAHVAPTLTQSDLPNRDAAALADRLTAQGRRVCTVGESSFALAPYTSVVRTVPVGQLQDCDVVVQVFTPVPNEPRAAPSLAPGFPYRRVLPARYPGVVSARAPLPAQPSE